VVVVITLYECVIEAHRPYIPVSTFTRSFFFFWVRLDAVVHGTNDVYIQNAGYYLDERRGQTPIFCNLCYICFIFGEDHKVGVISQSKAVNFPRERVYRYDMSSRFQTKLKKNIIKKANDKCAVFFFLIENFSFDY
jgi:hypothetical protein